MIQNKQSINILWRKILPWILLEKKINNRKFKTFAYGNVMIYRQLTNGNLIKMSKSPTNFIKLWTFFSELFCCSVTTSPPQKDVSVSKSHLLAWKSFSQVSDQGQWFCRFWRPGLRDQGLCFENTTLQISSWQTWMESLEHGIIIGTMNKTRQIFKALNHLYKCQIFQKHSSLAHFRQF